MTTAYMPKAPQSLAEVHSSITMVNYMRGNAYTEGTSLSATEREVVLHLIPEQKDTNNSEWEDDEEQDEEPKVELAESSDLAYTDGDKAVYQLYQSCQKKERVSLGLEEDDESSDEAQDSTGDEDDLSSDGQPGTCIPCSRKRKYKPEELHVEGKSSGFSQAMFILEKQTTNTPPAGTHRGGGTGLLL